MRRERSSTHAGFTLVEVSIILTVTVILSAIITPVLSSTLGDSRLSAARAEIAAISQALQEFLVDLGCEIVPRNHQYDTGYRRSDVVMAPFTTPPNLPPAAAGGEIGRQAASALARSACSAAGICDDAPVELLVSSGDIPALGPEGSPEWVRKPDWDAVDFLEFYLISNTPGSDRDRAFPTPEDCVDPVSARFSEVRAWRGAYLSVGGGDPWGNRYMINTVFLSGRHTEDVVVLSAGPDQEVDSAFAMDGFVPGDDDVAMLFSTGH